MMATNNAVQPPGKKRRWLRVALWLLLAPVALLVGSASVLWASPSLREWAATKVMTGGIIRNQLADTPPRTKAQPIRKTTVRMRDGTELSTQVFLPEGDGPWPVILVRDPYSFAQYISCKVFVQYDYACVYQEVRGRGPSQGIWYPFVDERRDGLDTIAWILEQPWQSGRLAMYGGSYVGVVQWAVAGDLPPEVKTFVPTVAHGDVYQLAYRNGMFNEGIAGIWLYTQMKSPLQTLLSTRKWRKEIAGRFPANGVESSGFGSTWTAYKDYLMHPEKGDPYWNSTDYIALREAHRNVQVPVLMIGFANDFFLPGMLTSFEELPSRAQSVFVIGPGNHGGGADAEIEGSYTQAYVDTLAWFDHHLRGAPLPESLRPGIKVFVHGDASWRNLPHWPDPARSIELQLDRLAESQPCDGGLLSTSPPAPGQAVGYAYDPRNPAPTRGGPFELISDAVQEQGNDICDRPDVLSFSSEPMPSDTLINGGMRVSLKVSSDAQDTAFTVKVSEHFADGRVYNIRDDISTLSLRNGSLHRIPYVPGEEVEVVFDLTPIAWQLHKGSRLRLDISSSSAPAFFPHPNRAGLWSVIADPVVAQQTIHGGSLVIPVESAR